MWPVIIILFLTYVGYKFYTRVVEPFREVKKNFEEGMRNRGPRPQDTRQEGEVKVEAPKNKGETPLSGSIDGEYVEYEEVD